jgi:hypothetical protein
VAAVAPALVLLVVGVHFVYLAVLVFGGLAARRWPRLVGWHLGAVAWAAGAVTVRYDCPLTALEERLRELAGWSLHDGGFLRNYVRGVLFPEALTPLIVAAIMGVIATGWVRLASRAPA